MKAQDILVLLKIFLKKNERILIKQLAHELFISASEVHAAIQRLKKSRLLREDPLSQMNKINIGAMEEFLIHGFKYVFPLEEGKEGRGTATLHSAPPLDERMQQEDNDIFVWPYEFGNIRGKTIKALYPSVPKAVEHDKDLYELLVILDGIRSGRARESQIASEELRKRLNPNSDQA